MLVDALRELFPVVGDVDVPYHWGGPLGVPRDWEWSARFDRTSGLASAGGYVGDGVSTTNVAGRTLADLIHGVRSDLTELPWADHRQPRWEPEPLRWLGINLGRRAAARADRAEQSSLGRCRQRARSEGVRLPGAAPSVDRSSDRRLAGSSISPDTRPGRPRRTARCRRTR